MCGAHSITRLLFLLWIFVRSWRVCASMSLSFRNLCPADYFTLVWLYDCFYLLLSFCQICFSIPKSRFLWMDLIISSLWLTIIILEIGLITFHLLGWTPWTWVTWVNNNNLRVWGNRLINFHLVGWIFQSESVNLFNCEPPLSLVDFNNSISTIFMSCWALRVFIQINSGSLYFCHLTFTGSSFCVVCICFFPSL